MSKYLSTTQVSCPGSLCREEGVSHGLAHPKGWTPVPTRVASTIYPRGLLSSAPAWEERDGVSSLSPAVMRLWMSLEVVTNSVDEALSDTG